MADDGNLASEFRTVTGCTSAAEASHYLEMCNGNLELAINLYFQQLQPSSSHSRNGSNSPDIGQISDNAQQGSSMVTRRKVREASGSRAKQLHNKISVAGHSDVREPIAPVRGPIIEQTFTQQYGRQNRPHVISVFDSTRDFRAEAEERLLLLQNGQNLSDSVVAKRLTLQNLFRPPFDIMCTANWNDTELYFFKRNFTPEVALAMARAEAQRKQHWLLVNLQDDLEFACQALNRDVWSNSSVKELIRSNFVFWQVSKDSADGHRVSNYYRIQSYPAIFVVDPRTGEQLTTFIAKDTVSFCDQATSFIDKCPDFGSRDRLLTGEPACDTSEQSTSQKGLEQHNSNVTIDILSAAARKRVNCRGQYEMMEDSCSDPKKLREDIDGIMDIGSKLTTIDRDEWLKYLGQADGFGCRISLSLRFPDGSRQVIEMEDTTTLKAVFFFIAGLGFYPADHHLVLDYPKRMFTDQDHCRTLRELGFNKRELIHVERQ